MTREEAIAELNTFKIGAKSELGENALDVAIKALDKCDKIEQIISDWYDVPWGASRTVMQATLLKIEDVLEKEKEIEE